MEISPYSGAVIARLKWSLWSAERDYWEEYAPGVWDAIRAAWEGSGSHVSIAASSRKETRYGDVAFARGVVNVDFWSETEDADGNDIEHHHWGGTVAGGTFEEVMQRIDQMEEAIIEWEQEDNTVCPLCD